MNEMHFNRLINMYNSAPINQYFNPKIEISLGKSLITIQVSENLHHSAKTLHGSVYFKMLDDAAYFAASSYIEDVFIVTTTFTTYFTRPISEGVIYSKGKVVNRSKSQIIAEAVLYDKKKVEIARGSGVFIKSKFDLENTIGYSS